MAAKNSISVKSAKEPILLAAFLKCGISAKKTRQVSGPLVAYIFTVTHYQQLFELGYWFSQFNRESL